MSLALTLPLVSLLIGLPGIPGLSKRLPKLRLPHKAVVDTLPPVWKPYSLLVLEDQFVSASLAPIGSRWAGIKVTNDPRRLDISVDPDSGTVTAVTEMGEVPIASGARVPFAQYNHELAWQSFQRAWAERSRQSVNNVAGSGTPVSRPGMQFALPLNLPKAYTSILGPGGPAINVSGSENIKLAGTSEWSNEQLGLTGQRRSLFPSLDMQQDLDIRLEGQLSDRVKVNLLQNSATQIPLANKIAINYKGDEDDLVQSLDLGNTNLTLPGTQYVSYSGRNEGLFGMKATTRTGPLDFTVLASKQEGRSERASYAGGSSRQKVTKADFDYERGVYFLLYDPNLETQFIDPASITLYLDDRTSNRVNFQRGRAFVDPRTAQLDSTATTNPTFSARGIFTQLIQGAENDYEILNDVYGPLYKVIRLNKRPVTGDQQLAVTYRYQNVAADGLPVGPQLDMGGLRTVDTDGDSTVVMKLLRAPPTLLPADDHDFFRTDTLMAATRELELHNFYTLGGQDIDPKSFSLTIRHGNDDPPVTFLSLPNGDPVPYSEILGLDNFDETGGTPVYRKHDGKVDGTFPSSTSRFFVDYKNGILFFFDPRPFAPRIKDDPNYPARPFDRFLSNILFRRDSLVGAENTPDERNRDIYDLRTPVRSNVIRYSIDLEFTAARAGNEINLGRSNIIEGSEAVTINGRRLEREHDYTVDYDLGRVTLKAAPGGADQVNVDYSYAPLFQQAGRTLLGSAFRLEGQDRHLGGAFMYESKGAQDLRPRLGEEPSRVLIGDLNAEWRMRPDFLTRWVDALPGVRTTAPSEFNVSAEMGASLPNPNTFNEVYVDDMEGVRDAVSLIMTPERWHWSSMPSRKRAVTGVIDTLEAFPNQKNAEVHWYTPLNAVKERELKPNLTDAQGAQNPHQALAISVPRRPPASGAGDSLWVGLTYALDPVGVDLSRSQFIEVWVNDFRDPLKVPRVPGAVKLHLDLGVVSEDERRSPGVAANHRLDTEDLGPLRDNQLTVTSQVNEDTGLDGRPDHGDSAEVVRDPSLTTSDANDPQGDDFRSPNVDSSDPRHNLDPDRWLFINGTENNKNVVPIPDTEDLNLNNNLDLQEDYFEYTIDLASSPYLADSVYGSRSNYENNGEIIPADNGWRRYRIPIGDSLRVKFGSPDLTVARHVRVWVEGITQTDDVVSGRQGEPVTEKRPLLMLGGIDIVGSRWLATDLTTPQESAGTTLTLNSVNNVDNADIYKPPFDPGSTRNGAQDLVRREQSLALEFTHLLRGDSLEAFKTFSLDENYSRYGTLRFWVAGYNLPGYDPSTDSLFYFVRFASDERGLNFYEYRAPVPRPSATNGVIDWSEVRLKLTDLSNLKLDPATIGRDTIVAPGPSPGVTLTVKGRPSFTRLRRISFGLINQGPRDVDGGSVWLDELRATDVARDRGQAQRFSVSGKMSNLLNYNVNYNARDEDFLSVGETRGSGNRTSGWTATAGLDLHRFFAGTGIVLPVNVNLSGNRAQPRYTAGDDVLRTGALAEASESRVSTRSYSVSYGRTWSERSNPLLRYTVGGISASLSQARSENLSPSSVDTTRSTNATVGYSISPRRLVGIPLPGTKARLWPLPERFFWNYSVATSASRTYDRLRDANGSLVLRNDTRGRTAGVDFGADSRPFEFLHHQFQAHRNLSLPDGQLERIGFVNLGRVVQWNQTMDARYGLNQGTWLRPQFNWNASYYQNNGPELSPSLAVKQISNTGVFSVGWTLPFDQLTSLIRSGPADTLRRSPARWRSWFSHLGAVSVDAGINRGSQYTRLNGIPSFPYYVGFSNDPGLSDGRIGALFGNTSRQSQDFRTSGRTRLALGLGATIQTNGEFTTHRDNTNGVLNRERRVQFPAFDMDYGKLPEAIGLKHVFVNPRIRSTYSRNRTTDFLNNSSLPTTVRTSTEWRPLVGLTGDLKNGTRAELRVQHRATEDVNRQIDYSVTTDANTDIDLSLNRAYTKGQKVSFMGKSNTVKSNITLGLTGAYSRRKGETRRAGFQLPFNPVHEDRLNVNARGSYGFSNNVTGNAELGFSQNRNLQRGIVNRSIRVELRAQFTF